jgi:hypothetical protein
MDTGFRLTSRLVRGFCRVTPINLLHDPLSPADRIGNGAHRGWNPCPTVVLSPASAQQECWLQSAGPAFGLRPLAKQSIIRLVFAMPYMPVGGRAGGLDPSNEIGIGSLGWSQSLPALLKRPTRLNPFGRLKSPTLGMLLCRTIAAVQEDRHGESRRKQSIRWTPTREKCAPKCSVSLNAWSCPHL